MEARKRILKRNPPKPSRIEPVVSLTTSGANILDLALGGGFPWGKIINIIGDKSSGKTALAIECIYQAHKRMKDNVGWFYDDAEGGFSFNTKAMYEIDILPENEERYSETVEDFISNVKIGIDIGREKKGYIYILDSLDALTCDAEIGRAKDREKAKEDGKVYDKGTYNLEKQKLLNEFFRLHRKNIQSSNLLLIIISQIRANIGVTFGKKYIRTGGKALDFYASQIIELSETEKMVASDDKQVREIGVSVRAKVTKNKIGLPFRQADFKILFDYGVDNVDSNLCYLYDLWTKDGKTSKSIDVFWKADSFKKRSDLIKFIEYNDLEDELRKRCQEKWYAVEEALAPTHRKKK